MYTKLIRFALSGLLVVPLCVTAVVTAVYGHAPAGLDQKISASAQATGIDSTVAVATNESANPAATAVPEGILAAAGDSTAETETPTDPETAGDSQPGKSSESADQPNSDDSAPILPRAKSDGAAPQVPTVQPSSGYVLRKTEDGFVPGRLRVVDPRSGTLVPARRVTVRFIQRGVVVSESRPGIDGIFQAGNLHAGFYTIVASGEDGYLTMSAEVRASANAAEGSKSKRPSKASADDQARPADGFFRIDSVLVPPRELAVLRRIMHVYATTSGLGPRWPTPVPVSSTGSTGGQMPNMNRIGNTVAAKGVGDGDAALRTPVLALQPDGSVGGRLSRTVPDLTNSNGRIRIPLQPAGVFLVRNGAVVDRAYVDEEGQFKIIGARPGHYSLIAAGPGGVAAFGVSIIGETVPTTGTPAGSVRAVSSVQLVQNPPPPGGGTGMNVDVSDPNDLNNQNPQNQPQGPVQGGGGGGSGGGGGGGGFGGGGLLGILAGGALGAGIAAAAIDNNNNNNNPASPGSL